MNTLGPAVLLAMLAVSWEWQDYSKLDWKDVNNVEQGLEIFIDDYIKDNLPNASDIQFYDFHSEPVDESSIRVFFEYKFNHPLQDEETSVKLKGSTTLSKEIDDENSEYWQMGEVNISEESIRFIKELVVTG